MGLGLCPSAASRLFGMLLIGIRGNGIHVTGDFEVTV